MSSNLKVNTILPSTGTTIGIGTVGGLINVVGNIDVNSTSGISTFNGLEISGIVTAKAGAAVTYYGDGSNLTGITDNVVTINNNENNRIITGSGTANTLEGEANLTWNGTKFGVGTASPYTYGVATFNDSNGIVLEGSSQGRLLFRHTGGGTNLKMFDLASSDGVMKFRTIADNGTTVTERLRIDSSGRLLVNTTSVGSKGAASPLQIQTSNTAASSITIKNRSSNNDYSFIYFTDDDASEDLVQIGVTRTAANTGDIAFYTNGGSSASDEKFRIKGNGDVSITDGDLKIATAGHGIDFSATGDAGGMTSELLDDYEEGSFTPFFRGDGSAGSYGYSRQIGRYTKIGQRVFFNLYLTLNAVSANASGNLMIYGLPYTSEGSNAYSFAGVAYYYGFNGITPQSGLIDISNTRLYLYQNNATSNIVNSTPAGALTTTSSIIMGGQYSTG